MSVEYRVTLETSERGELRDFAVCSVGRWCARDFMS